MCKLGDGVGLPNSARIDAGARRGGSGPVPLRAINGGRGGGRNTAEVRRTGRGIEQCGSGIQETQLWPSNSRVIRNISTRFHITRDPPILPLEPATFSLIFRPMKVGM